MHSELSKLQNLADQLMSHNQSTARLENASPVSSVSRLDQVERQGAGTAQSDQVTVPAGEVIIDGVVQDSVAAEDIGNLHDRQLQALKRSDPSAFYGPASVFSIPSPNPPLKPSPHSFSETSAAEVSVFLSNHALVNSLFQCFHTDVNPMHRFLHTSVSTCAYWETNPLNGRLLTAAILSAGASVNQDGIGKLLADHAVSLALEAAQSSCELSVLQALTVLTWRELTFGDNSSRAWMLLGMAGGISQQLGLHMLTIKDDIDQKDRQGILVQVQAFWSFALVDRMGAAGLGCLSTIPWRHAETPRLGKTYLDHSPSLDDVYFDHLSELCRLHGTEMDKIYAPCFQKLDSSRKEALFLEIGQSLVTFYTIMDQRLLFPSNHSKAHPGLYLFHMAYETSAIILYRPFLFQSSDALFRSILQDMAAGASNCTDVLLQYRKHYSTALAPTHIIYHIVRAAVVHLLLATSNHLPVQRRSSRKLKVCFEALEEYQQKWYLPNHRAIEFLRGVASRWDVTKCLPMKWSSKLDTTDASSLNLYGPHNEAFSLEGGDNEGIDTSCETEDFDISYLDFDRCNTSDFMELQSTFDPWFLQSSQAG